MGAELCVYVLVGPRKLEEKKKKEAEEFLDKLLEMKDEVEKLVTDGLNFEKGVEEFLVQKLGEERSKLILEVLYNDYLVTFEGLYDYIDEHGYYKNLEDFFDLWEGKTYSRDVAIRYIKEGQQIVVAGDQTWGDEPAGLGYQTIKEATKLTLLPILGIE